MNCVFLAFSVGFLCFKSNGVNYSFEMKNKEFCTSQMLPCNWIINYVMPSLETRIMFPTDC